jgi:hypothetical protein
MASNADNNGKDISKESFILIRFENSHLTTIIDFKTNNVDEFQLLGAANMLELISKKLMMDSMSSVTPAVAEPPKLYKP